MASLETLISSSLFVFIFLTKSFAMASDFSALIIYLSKKSNPPIIVSFFEE